ncbi:type II secretion system F family protein [Paenibacillus yanchengensis]|uniref:Type II secretion system F family protein n=1 Tax=Paenibacillus yanchengensis TaxID=2035833 RepID=A0ABW4YJ52_9BACL
MSTVSFVAYILLLFSLQYLLWYHLLSMWQQERTLQHRLKSDVWKRYQKGAEPAKSLSSAQQSHFKKIKKNADVTLKIKQHIAELLEILRIPMTIVTFGWMTFFFLLAGTMIGGFFFQSTKGTLLFGVVIGLTPYLIIRSMLVQRRLQTQLDFLPAVELFYQCYLVTGERQVKVALQRVIEEKRLIGPMQSVYEQLYRNLSIRNDDETSLRLFASSLGHLWADHFVTILQVAMQEGVVVTESLQQLLVDMRKARRANELERNRLLEIRIANFSPVLFLIVFIGVNFYYNRANAYYYYLLDAQGRDTLLNALILIFLSFIMGLWLSRKKL